MSNYGLNSAHAIIIYGPVPEREKKGGISNSRLQSNPQSGAPEDGFRNGYLSTQCPFPSQSVYCFSSAPDDTYGSCIYQRPEQSYSSIYGCSLSQVSAYTHGHGLEVGHCARCILKLMWTGNYVSSLHSRCRWVYYTTSPHQVES